MILFVFSSLFSVSSPRLSLFITFPLIVFIVSTLSRSDSAVRSRLVFLTASLLLLLLTPLLPAQSLCVCALYKPCGTCAVTLFLRYVTLLLSSCHLFFVFTFLPCRRVASPLWRLWSCFFFFSRDILWFLFIRFHQLVYASLASRVSVVAAALAAAHLN